MVTVTGQNQNFYCNRERKDDTNIRAFCHLRITKSKEHNMKFFIAIFLKLRTKNEDTSPCFFKNGKKCMDTYLIFLKIEVDFDTYLPSLV
jgi:hypothetical protein